MVKKTQSKKVQPKKAQPSATRPPRQTAPSSSVQPTAETSHAQPLDLKHQQRLLDIFCAAFRSLFSDDALPERLQAVKQALFHRDFALAFGREDHLEAYAARWSPTRALCYASVLRGIVRAHLGGLLTEASCDDDTGNDVSRGQGRGQDAGEGEHGSTSAAESAAAPRPRRVLRMVSIGGCAAEQVAFASLLHAEALDGVLTLIDSGPWSAVTATLQSAITTAPELSKYASAAARVNNVPLLQDPQQLSLTFHQQDILSPASRLSTLLRSSNSQRPSPVLLTLFFTLNELYTSGGVAKTTRFLTGLADDLPVGSLLLVVDSPGSYSEAALGKENKKYPMHWLLDHTLRDPKVETPRWDRLESHDSVWYRLAKELSYPLQLEDMRYQLHLYRLKGNDNQK